jgi:hypothetical protein
VLPDWFDLTALRVVVSAAALVTAFSAILVLALTRRLVVRAGLAVVLVAASGALVLYHQGPLKDAERTCSYRFLKSDLAVDGCAVPGHGTQTAQGAGH